jgi:serine/threonine protein kinase
MTKVEVITNVDKKFVVPDRRQNRAHARTFKTTIVKGNKFTIDERYHSLHAIGDGSYGFVVSAIDHVTGLKVAIKKVIDAFNDAVDAKRILREMKLLRHLGGHENVVTIYDIMVYPQGTINFSDIYIVTNLFESDLDKIIQSQQKLTTRHLQFFLYQILRGLKYTQSANVLHRDLKPSNLLVNSNCDLALCDFGLARGFETDSNELLTEYVVTRWYRAPELLCDAETYGPSVDIWSVGCIFAEMLSNTPFFKGDSPPHQLEVIVDKIGRPSLDKLDFIGSKLAYSTVANLGANTGQVAKKTLRLFLPERHGQASYRSSPEYATIPPERQVDGRGMLVSLVLG